MTLRVCGKLTVKRYDLKRTAVATATDDLARYRSLSVLTDARRSQHSSLVLRLSEARDSVALPVIAVEEQLRAWLAQVRRLQYPHELVMPYGHLVRLLETLMHWEILRWTDEAADEFVSLRGQRIRIGTQDLRIAAIALSHDAVLLSSNLRDFEQVPQLRVEDWLHV